MDNLPEKLKPCPFCGGEATVNASMRERFVMCKGCAACSDMHASHDVAVEAWNKRTVIVLPTVSELVNRFLAWPLPDSLCASMPGVERPIGTHIMNADEARLMFEYCLPVTAGPQPLTDHEIEVIAHAKGMSQEWNRVAWIPFARACIAAQQDKDTPK